MRKFKRLTMTLALLIMAVGGAWADETPLVTIESKDYTSFTSGSKTFDNIATVTFSSGVANDGTEWGWYHLTGVTLTVTPVEGITITRVKFTCKDGSAYDETAPFEAVLGDPWYNAFMLVNGTSYGEYGVTKIEVYGAAAPSGPEVSGPTIVEGKPQWTFAMPAGNVELQVEYEPTKVTMAVNDKTMGTVEVSGENKVEWTADTWKGWMSDNKTHTVDDITVTSIQYATVNEYTYEGDYLHSLNIYASEKEDNASVTFSTTGDPFSRIEFTMIDDYNPGEGSYHGVPNIQPADGWTFEGKSAVWEGEATKSLTLQSCTTMVSKITFFKKGAVPDGVTVNGDGTFTVAKTATVTLTATPAEGYKFLYWDDDQTNTNPVREVTIESGIADKTYTAVFAEITYNVTFADGIEDADKWKAEPNAAAKNTEVKVTYSGAKKVLGMKVEKYNPDPKAVPLTFEVLTNGTIKVSFPRNGMKYSLNGGEKTAVPGGSESDISVKAGDIIEFYGNGSSYYNMGSDHTSFGGTAEVKVYGNIMSLLSETNFATATTLTAEQTFRELFRSYSKLTDASGLLLPAMTLTNNCYYEMFYSCSGMTAAPAELPAETLAGSCYYEMFSSCSKLTTAPVLPATSLVSNCYRSMFSYCSKLSSVTCLATSGIDSNNSTTNWMQSAGWQAAGDKTFTADKTAEWPNTVNGIPDGWTRVDYVAPGN